MKKKNSNQKVLSPSFVINYCIKKKKNPRKPLQLSCFFKFSWYPVKVVASCGSIILACFDLNSVEAREGMPLLTFLDEKRGIMLVTLSFFLW